ncbi:hypothetical protein M409DRAFT_35761 [Zasmidium cellare ATCC 36951]|uniref:Uncharacterized protein n=1 Tax=Zasmidium cellare ATCC 36951 TaxID=1080233 RepID=A0A6A6CY64_ZASCE|nr:uncharacterized protein M409DRAFT_35761 [Zasmidium cellare ATCC 36951]KAF2171663.1 hypothetical protein M409DRAFT_35761 [Zasmidium cellare ATCC 36951]
MSHLTYSSYAGFGQRALQNTHYQQAVLLPPGPTLHISGQGGWDRTTVAIPSDITAEVEQAFDNVDHTLKDAGGKGMEQVYKLVVYCTLMDDAVEGALKAGLRKWFPKHQPILTGVGVAKLAFEGMHVEIEASAHLG